MLCTIDAIAESSFRVGWSHAHVWVCVWLSFILKINYYGNLNNWTRMVETKNFIQINVLLRFSLKFKYERLTFKQKYKQPVLDLTLNNIWESREMYADTWNGTLGSDMCLRFAYGISNVSLHRILYLCFCRLLVWIAKVWYHAIEIDYVIFKGK